MLELNNIYNMDCIEGMKQIDAESIDMIFCDLPYQVTHSSFDIMVPFEPMWKQFERIIKGDVVLDPFMGIGGAGVAAKKLCRNFIGCEIDSKYFEVAESRILKGYIPDTKRLTKRLF